MVFTAFPLGARACLDQDVSDEDGLIISQLTPFIYKENKIFPIFDVKNFMISLLRGTIHGIINFILVIFSLWNNTIDEKGNNADLWFLSVVLYTNIISVKFKLF